MKFKSLLTVILVFSLPVSVSLFNTFSVPDFDRCIVWDSAHYALSGKLLLDWLIELSKGHYQNPHDLEMGYSLLLDGLPMPTLAAALLFLSRLFSWKHTAALLCTQSIISGLSGLLIYLLGRKLGLTRKFCIGGALAWAVYPGQVVNAARFMTEPPTAFLLLLTVYLLASLLPRNARTGPSASPETRQSYWIVFICGITMAVMAHVKTVLTPLSMALVALTLLNIRPLKKTATVAALLAGGGFIALLPWLTFTQVTLHHRTMLPDRQSGYNMSMGVDTDYDGWATFPAGSRLEMCREDNAQRTLAAAIKDRGPALAALFARKVERLWKNSWNDFYAQSLGLRRPAQNSLHQLLLLCATLGAVYLLVTEKLLSERVAALSAAHLIKLSALLIVAFHLIYVPFEAQSRYAFPTTPWLLLLAMIGLDHLKNTWNSKLAIICVSFTVLILLVERLDLAPLLMRMPPLASIEAATTAVNFIAALAFSLWLSFCFQAAELKRLGECSRRRAAFVGLASLLVCCGFLALKERNLAGQQWHTQLRCGETIERRIKLPARLAAVWSERFASAKENKKAWAAVIIDGENLENSEIKLNGKSLGQPESLIKLADGESQEPSESIIFSQTAKACGRTDKQMRQWLIAAVDPQDLNLSGEAQNKLECTVGNPAIVFGQYPSPNRRLMLPDLWGFSFGQSTMTNDLRPINTTTLAAAEDALSSGPHGKTTASQPDLSSAAGLQTGQYRLHLVLGWNHPNQSLNQRSLRHSFKNIF